MKVFVAGAGGAIGKRLVPRLFTDGYEVAAMTRSAAKAAELAALGADPVIAEALDRDAVIQAVVRAQPEVVIHELTGLTGVTNLKNFDREFALTNRLRTEGTYNLVAAARAAGARRLIAQSYGNWIYERSGTTLKTENDRLDPHPPAKQVRSLQAIRDLESAVTGTDGIEGLALRYGGFYGPGTHISEDGEVSELVRKRRFPIIGDGAGVWTFVHIDDAASATVAAIRRGSPGIYNVVDDEPVAVARWLPALAHALGARPPRRVPVWAGRLVVGEVAVSMMTRIRGASNAKAKRELGWTLRYPTYREGFREGLGAIPPAGPATVGGQWTASAHNS